MLMHQPENGIAIEIGNYTVDNISQPLQRAKCPTCKSKGQVCSLLHCRRVPIGDAKRHGAIVLAQVAIATSIGLMVNRI